MPETGKSTYEDIFLFKFSIWWDLYLKLPLSRVISHLNQVIKVGGVEL